MSAAKNLVIVESPAKAKTIQKYLGQEFETLSSYGHIRDLIPKTGAVEPEKDFVMHYQLILRNEKYAKIIAKAVKGKLNLYLATDPDREGEAIAWHIHEFLKEKKVLENINVYRIIFHEITQNAIKEAIAHPKNLSMHLIDAQQARRALDYLVGFTLSPLLWKKVRRGLSAGRVQSPALRLITERELEIEKFESKEYWTLSACLLYEQTKTFQAKLTVYDNKKLAQFDITTEKAAHIAKSALFKAANGVLTVQHVQKKERKKQPAAPFITSTLQQEAAHKLGFTAKKTMFIAQQLYEGVDIGEGLVGLITYMRTDSTTLSKEALSSIHRFIKEQYGQHVSVSTSRIFKTKSKNAQEAHEAIRPTYVAYTPETIKHALNEEQQRLYDLIWKRTVASQMTHATLESLSIDFIDTKENRYHATGTTVLHAGFLNIYQETEDIKNADEALTTITHEKIFLPLLEIGERIKLQEITADQHFTEAPPRYNEASLIKNLEVYDIGRPSTYVPIITTLLQREYVTLVKKRFQPTDVGKVVYQFLINYFNQYIDYGFTAKLEDALDEIARGEKRWKPILKDFWITFKQRIEQIESTVQRADVTQEKLEENCPKCGKMLTKRLGKRGNFIGCSAYPECDYTRNLNQEDSNTTPETITDRLCPQCNATLHIKQGRYGKFIGCSHYPKCRYIESIEKPISTKIQCPECHQADLLKRKSRYEKIFYSCARYPDCQYAIWGEPLAEVCPTCAWSILMLRITKRKGKEKVCPRKTCQYATPF